MKNEAIDRFYDAVKACMDANPGRTYYNGRVEIVFTMKDGRTASIYSYDNQNYRIGHFNAKLERRGSMRVTTWRMPKNPRYNWHTVVDLTQVADIEVTWTSYTTSD